jgi:hypothetical protein
VAVYRDIAMPQRMYNRGVTRKNIGLSFGGVNDYIEVPDSDALRPSYITVEALVYPTSNPDIARVVCKLDGERTEYALDVRNGVVIFYIADGTNWYNANSGSYTLELNKWHHLVGIYDGSSIKVYVNGDLKGTNTVSLTIAHSTYPLTIGADAYAGSAQRRWDGYIAYARIYNRALSDTEIAWNMNNINNPVTDGLVMWLPMNEGVGSTVYDHKWTSDPYGYKAVYLDGVQNYIDVVDSSSFQFSENMSLEFIVKVTGAVQTGIHQTIMSKHNWADRDNDGTSNIWGFWVECNRDSVEGQLAFAFGDGYRHKSVVANNVWTYDETCHFVITVTYKSDVDLSDVILYKNGQVASQWNDVDSRYENISGQTFRIGSINYTLNQLLRGNIILVRMYNRTLSEFEIQHNYNNPYSPATDGLVLYLPLNEGIGNVVKDYSGYGNDGTIKGTNDGTIYGASWIDDLRTEVL